MFLIYGNHHGIGGNAPQIPSDLLQALKHVGEQCALEKRKDVCHVAASVGWLVLTGIQKVPERQREAEMCAVHLEEELKQERNMHLLTVDSKDALGRQLGQTGEQLWDLVCTFARVWGQ